jgi:cation transporter-like permease
MMEEQPYRHPRARQSALPGVVFGLAAMLVVYALGSLIGVAGTANEATVVIRETLWVASILGSGVVMSWFVVVKLRRRPEANARAERQAQ